MVSVFIKRYPSKGEFPSDYSNQYLTNKGLMYGDTIRASWHNIEYWLKEIELPSDEDIYNAPNWDSRLASFRNGANFILNKLKGAK